MGAAPDEHHLGPDPEAERAAASPRQPLGLWWWLGVAGLVGAAGLLVMGENLRAYGYAVSLTLAALAMARAVLPPGTVGGIAVRTRWVDVATLSLLGGAIAILTSTLRLT